MSFSRSSESEEIRQLSGGVREKGKPPDENKTPLMRNSILRVKKSIRNKKLAALAKESKELGANMDMSHIVVTKQDTATNAEDSMLVESQTNIANPASD